MKAERLATEFAPRGITHGGAPLLLPTPDALAMIGRAAEEGVPIVGVDGIRVREDAATSPVEPLADFSSAVATGHGCWEAADALVRSRGDSGLLFEVTLGSDPVEVV